MLASLIDAKGFGRSIAQRSAQFHAEEEGNILTAIVPIIVATIDKPIVLAETDGGVILRLRFDY